LEAIVTVGEKARGSIFHCVDQDAEANEYAKKLLQGIKTDHVELHWENRNAFRFQPKRFYDLVWSAGLFDYLNDRLAIALIKNMWKWTADGGTMVVGNFHQNNPTRNYMEWGLDWVLIHRTEEDFMRLCHEAGIPDECVRFDYEPFHTIIFCIAEKKK